MKRKEKNESRELKKLRKKKKKEEMEGKNMIEDGKEKKCEIVREDCIKVDEIEKICEERKVLGRNERKEIMYGGEKLSRI